MEMDTEILAYRLECSVPEGYAVDGDDCDDNDATSYLKLMRFAMRLIHCDGVIDYLAVDGTTYYADADAEQQEILLYLLFHVFNLMIMC